MGRIVDYVGGIRWSQPIIDNDRVRVSRHCEEQGGEQE
jgi:hypothetical protein